MTTSTQAAPVQSAAAESPSGSAPLILEPMAESGGRSAGLWEVVRIAFDSLLANKIRSFLTMLGVIIGVASVVTLVTLGNGASAAITGQVEAIGTNVLTLIPGSGGGRGPGNNSQAQNLTVEDAEAISKLNLPVAGVAPQFGGSGQLVAKAADTGASIQGITADYQPVNNLVVLQGSFITDDHVRSMAPVVVLGSQLASDLFGSGQALGQTIRVGNTTLRVIGVLESEGGSAFGSNDDRAFVPISLAQKRMFGARTPDGNGFRVSAITLSALNSDDLPSIQRQVETLLRQRHRVSMDGSEDDFQVFNQAEFLSTLTTVTTTLTLFLAAVAGISLLVGGIGIMNIMLVSVTERTREIGLRKAVGARAQAILLQFVVEALVLSLVGGLIGLTLGSIIPIVVTAAGFLDAPVTWDAIAMSIGFSMAVGLFFGIYPAQRAARLNPIDALRHE
ncbi:MAG TPA: ABC transporter permease [Herpetosiphonaceae bacterium]